MRLFHPFLSDHLTLREGRIPLLVVENTILFRQMVSELLAQSEGGEGRFVLSENYKPLDCGEHLHLIHDFIRLNPDSRKLQAHFQTFLRSLILEELQDESSELQEAIARFLKILSSKVIYTTECCAGEYVLPLLKSLKFRPCVKELNPSDQLIQYLQIHHELLPRSFFVLVHAHSYFSSKELEEILTMAVIQRWNLLLLEPCLPTLSPYENVYLLDHQLCELRLEKET